MFILKRQIEPSPFEIRAIVDAFVNPNMAAVNGIRVEGNTYFVIKVEGRFMYGRKVRRL